MTNVTKFIEDWSGRGYEKGDTHTFWLQFLRDVLNIDKPEQFIQFELQVPCGFIDAYLPNTRVIIEQKSLTVKLDDEVFKQAKRYNDALNFSRKARWIITCNFREFLIYDMDKNKPATEPVKIALEDLPDKFHTFGFMVKKRLSLPQERKLSFEAGNIIKRFYVRLKKRFDNKYSPETFQKLNKICVRLVFCLYAESADVFKEHEIFSEYLKDFNDDKHSFRSALIEIFNVLNTQIDNRSKYINDTLKSLPYIDGKLFEEELDFPEFRKDIRDIFFNELCNFKWADISPTIFGAVFESTLYPTDDKDLTDDSEDIRRKGGIHYTAPANIHKVINPLFMNDLYSKFAAANSRDDLYDLQNELANIKIFDPACGSGNFLTESYLLLRELENDIIEVLVADGVKFNDNPIKVTIEQFYGIEINDFAVAVAKTALWISEIQMRQKTAKIIGKDLAHFPLKRNSNIACGNALTIDWNEIINQRDCTYIISNPPFIGHQWRTAEQVEDMKIAFHDLDKHGKLDYVCAWYNKAADFVRCTNIRCAFVSTNSIVQGESVSILWRFLFDKIHIDFAYRTFIWDSESDNKAHVYVVIIGFSNADNNKAKLIYDGDAVIVAKNINGYLLDAPNVFIENRGKPLNKAMPIMTKGSQPTDGGNLIIKAEDYADFVKNEPLALKYIRPFIGAEEFINGKKRYCLWLVDCPPDELRKMKLVYERVKKVAEMRRKSPTKSVREAAETPALFTQIRQPDTNYLVIPRVSGESRKYIPIGFMTSDIIAGDAILIIPSVSSEKRDYIPFGFVTTNTIVSNLCYFIANDTLYLFGVLTSSVHMAWTRIVCGYLGTSYRYSPAVYNNFPFVNVTGKQKAAIETTAQAILDVRARYAGASLADLYDTTTMPKDLRQAHIANDKAVMAAYGFKYGISEAEIVGELFKMYEALTIKT